MIRSLSRLLLLVATAIAGLCALPAADKTALAARGLAPRSTPSAVPSATAAALAPGQVVVTDVTVFYEPLAPYGRWFNHTRFGYCWIPNGIVGGWRPYTHGYWDYTDDGWTWVSYDTWGWGPYHYGRWEFDPGYGWVWIPGTVWGPAWVAWRRGPGYIGWAPLPFEARWEAGAGLVNFDYDRYIEPHWYCFVGERHFGDRYVERAIEVPARNITIIHNTTYITNNYTVINNRVVNRGIDREEAQRAIGRSIEVHHIRETTDARGTRVNGSDLMIYRPGAQQKGARTPPGITETSGGVKYAQTDQANLDKQHQKEQARLAQEQIKEKNKLEKQHNQDLKAVEKAQRKAQNQGLSVNQIKVAQDNEHKAHDQRWGKEKDALTSRHQAESTGKMPAASYTPPKPPKQSGPPPSGPKGDKGGKKH